MDLRVEKTKKHIINAFIELRSKKPLEKITIRELSELAKINKSTFYAHYEDIFALSDAIESDLVSQIVNGIEHPDDIFEKTAQSIRELMLSCVAHQNLIRIIFSGNQEGHLPQRLESSIKELIFRKYPQYRTNAKANIFLSYCIYGGFHAYQQNLSLDLETVIATISTLAEGSKEGFLHNESALTSNWCKIPDNSKHLT